ncbi:polysaccharide pyruvyl transferase family protein [Pelagimonas varians]|uniref:polysaccharide pyruvyl transferase family protein n=1 Tax=Pelagimonas varians TaxID=696760 RepID=UPI0014738F86|nr:polysaccharide pyruvyl transferase family protein [Pelagimonas varians]
MTKYYLDLPVLDRTSAVSSYTFSSADIMSASGVNIGNFAFRHALRFIIKDLLSYTVTRYPAYLNAARENKVDSVIVSCANWLGTSDADEAANFNRAAAFEATDASTVCFGLGVQAQSGVSFANLGPNTQRLAKVLAERCNLLSVRDETTQNTLEKFGITNTVVTGCPSNFINGNPDLGMNISATAQELLGRVQSWQGVRAAICEFSGGNPASGRVLQAKLRLLETSPAFYIVQSPTLLPFTMRETREIPASYLKNNPFGESVERLRRVLRSKVIYFSSIESWMDFARTCDLSYGMRIHGNMVPLQAGVPSVLISHDSRTSGLANIMGIPQVSAEDFADNHAKSPLGILEIIAEKMQDYDKKRRGLANVMCDYLQANEIEAHPSILGVAGR